MHFTSFHLIYLVIFWSYTIIFNYPFQILSKYSISICFVFSFYALYFYFYFLLLILLHLLYLHVHLTPSSLPTHFPHLPYSLPQLTPNPPLILLNLIIVDLLFLPKFLQAWLLELQILINRELSNRNAKIKCLLIHFCIYFKLTKY